MSWTRVFRSGCASSDPTMCSSSGDRGSASALTPRPTLTSPSRTVSRPRAAVVSYTGDTGPSDAVGEFLAGCSVLIGECALRDPPEMEFHLAPSGLARIATLADPELLIVHPRVPAHSPSRRRADGRPTRVRRAHRTGRGRIDRVHRRRRPRRRGRRRRSLSTPRQTCRLRFFLPRVLLPQPSS